MKLIVGIVIGVLIALGYSTFISGRTAYTLYRGSIVNTNDSVHIATFDAKESEKHNRENCEIARDLFQSQPGVQVRYWCSPK